MATAQPTQAQLLIVLQARDLLTATLRKSGDATKALTKEAIALLDTINRVSGGAAKSVGDLTRMEQELRKLQITAAATADSMKNALPKGQLFDARGIEKAKSVLTELGIAAKATSDILSKSLNRQIGTTFDTPFLKAKQELQALGLSAKETFDVLRAAKAQINGREFLLYAESARKARDATNQFVASVQKSAEAAKQAAGQRAAFDPTKLDAARRALQGIGITAEQASKSVRDLFGAGVPADFSTPLLKAKQTLRELGFSATETFALLRKANTELSLSGLSEYARQAGVARDATNAFVASVERAAAATRAAKATPAILDPAKTSEAINAVQRLTAGSEQAGRAVREALGLKTQGEIAATRDRLRELGFTATQTFAILRAARPVPEFGLDPKKLQAAQAALAGLGVQAEQAGQAINTAFRDRLKLNPQQIKQAQAALQGLGLSAAEVGRVLQSVGITAQKTFGQQIAGAFAPLTRLLKSTAVTLIGAFAALNAFQTGVRNALAFSRAMAQVATVSTLTRKELALVGDEVKRVSLALGLNEVDTAKGLYLALSSGITDTADALELVTAASELATAGFADTATVVDVLTSAINAYGFEVSEARRLNDLFFATVRVGKAELPQLAESLGSVLPVAAQMGVRIEEVLAGVATLTLGGRDAAESVTGLRGILLDLLDPTKEAAKFLERLDRQTGALGGKTFPEIIRETGGLVKAFEILRTNVSGSEEDLRKLFDNSRAFTAATALLGNQYYQLARNLREIELSAGVAREALAKVAESPAKRFEVLSTGIRQGLESVGDAFIAAFSGDSIKQANRDALELKATLESIAGIAGAIGGALREVVSGIKGFLLSLATVRDAGISLVQILFGDEEDAGKRVGKMLANALASAKNYIDLLPDFVSDRFDSLVTSKAEEAKKQLKSVNDQLEGIGKQFFLADTIDELRKRLDEAGGSTSAFADETRKLIGERAQLQAMVKAFEDMGILAREAGAGIEQAASEWTKLRSAFDVLSAQDALKDLKLPPDVVEQLKAFNDTAGFTIKQLREIEKGKTLGFDASQIEKAKEIIESLRKATVTLPDNIAEVVNQFMSASEGATELLDGIDKLKLAAKQLDLGFDIERMFLEARAAQSQFFGDTSKKVADAKTEIARLGIAYKKAISDLPVQREEKLFGEPGTLSAANKELEFVISLTAAYESNVEAQERLIANAKRLAESRQAATPAGPALTALSAYIALLKQTGQEVAKRIDGELLLKDTLVSAAFQQAEKAAIDLRNAESLRKLSDALAIAGPSWKKYADAARDAADANEEVITRTVSRQIRDTFEDLENIRLQFAPNVVEEFERDRVNVMRDLAEMRKSIVALSKLRIVPPSIGTEIVKRFDEEILRVIAATGEAAKRGIADAQADVIREMAQFSGAASLSIAAPFENASREIDEQFRDLAENAKRSGLKFMLPAIEALRRKFKAGELTKLAFDLSLRPEIEIDAIEFQAQINERFEPLLSELGKQLEVNPKLIGDAEFIARLREVVRAMREARREFEEAPGAFGKGFTDEFEKFRAEVTRFKEGQALFRSLQNGFDDFFVSIMDGSKSAKEAFKDFASSVLSDILRLLSQRAFLNLFSSLGFGGLFGGAAGAVGGTATGTASGLAGGSFIFAKGGVMPGKMQGFAPTPKFAAAVSAFEKGGVHKGHVKAIGDALGVQTKAYGFGGVARTPQLALFGEGRGAEAFVPLPDGKNIPVKFQGPPPMADSGRRVEHHTHHRTVAVEIQLNVQTLNPKDVQAVLIEQKKVIGNIVAQAINENENQSLRDTVRRR